MVTAFIINLKTSEDRKQYMKDVMAPMKCLNPVFIEAVNGRQMSKTEIDDNFNQKGAFAHYGRELLPAEIGCTLSHKKCAQALLDSKEQFTLILEDDLIWQVPDVQPIISALSQTMCTKKPTIILLSGDYWYTSLHQLNGSYKLANVRDAVCAQAYLINRAAAERLLRIDNWHLADDWLEIKKSGIRIKAVYPHIADQNRSEIQSVISQVYGGIKRNNISLGRRIASYYRSFVNKILVLTNHFEAKNFKWKQQSL